MDNARVERAFLLQHGYALLFATVLAEQVGLPVPAAPFLLAAGALAGMGRLDPGSALLVTLLAAALSDAMWFELGRRKGSRILSLLCRLSLEPDSCVRRTEEAFVRRGPNTLLVAKFVPGLTTVAPPLAGIIGMSRLRFHLLSTTGAFLWASTWMLLGWLFRHQLDRVVRRASELGVRLGVVLGLAFVAWLLYKWDQRRRFLRRLWIARIAPGELKSLMDSGSEVVVVDLRGPIDFQFDPVVIPGALRVPPEELEARDPDIPRESEIVLYCTCPNEATSARVAVSLHRRGIWRVRPLDGGLAAWRAAGLPVASHSAPPP
jgi:membrane protein DedA with SNARE-associated domain/rhodanese-related sulfurtransferase